MRSVFHLLMASLLVMGALTKPVLAADWIALDHDSPLRAVYLVRDNRGVDLKLELWLNVGEADFDGAEGRAHYLEHLVASAALKITDADMVGAHSNAATSHNWTRYHQVTDIDNFPASMERLSQVFDQDLLDDVQGADSETEIILRELQYRTADNPLFDTFDKAHRDFFVGSGTARSILGKLDEIKSFSPGQAQKDFTKFYHPSNAWLLITAPANPKRGFIEAVVRTYFDALPAGSAKGPRRTPMTVTPERLPTVQVEDPRIGLNQFLYNEIQSIPPFTDRSPKERLTAIIARDLIGDWLNGRGDGSFAKTFVSQQAVLNEVGFNLFRNIEFIMGVGFFASFEPGTLTHAQVERLMVEHLEQRARDGMPADIFDKLKKRRLRNQARDFKRAPAQVDLVTRFAVQDEVPPTAADVLEAIEAVSLDEVNAVLRQITSGERRRLAIHIFAKGAR